MSPDTSITAGVDRLYDLLPAIYRQRDVEQGRPLQMLLRVIAEQVNLVEQDIAQLYENWFIETCQDWVVPFIADLIGFQPVNPPDPNGALSNALEMVLIPRREVANTIRYRRRKGTLSLLEDLAGAVSGWPALVVEFDHRVSATQRLDHLQLARGRYADLRDTSALDLIGSAFDPLSHSIELRQLNSPLSQGRYSSASVAVLVGRLRSFPVTHSLAACREESGDHCYTFSILGNDVPLYTRADCTDWEREIPLPIGRIAFRHEVTHDEVTHSQANKRFYGEDKGLAIWAKGWSDCDPGLPIPASRIIPADLTNWRYRPRLNHIAVDPQLGRIAFPPDQLPPGEVRVCYLYGFASEIGGGEYPRPDILASRSATIYEVGAGLEFSTIHSACEQWEKDKKQNAVIEIADSSVYEEQIHLVIPAKQTLELRAASGARPVILLADWHANRPDALTVVGEPHSQFTLDGVMIAGRGIQLSGQLETLTIRHTTLVPGWSLHPDGRTRRSGEPSLVLNNLSADVSIERSILGGIEIVQDSEEVDPLQLHLSDSIVDAARPSATAVGAPLDSIAAARLTIRNCTILGRVQTHTVELAENTLFLGELRVARRQQGCVRFCYVPTGSRTPRRYHCQPDLVEQAAMQEASQQGLPPQELHALHRAEQLRIEPQLLSRRYGTPDYCRLADTCAAEILTGADDRSEMGVFHDLFQPQRAANLRTRLHQFTPAGVDAGIIFVS